MKDSLDIFPLPVIGRSFLVTFVKQHNLFIRLLLCKLMRGKWRAEMVKNSQESKGRGSGLKICAGMMFTRLGRRKQDEEKHTFIELVFSLLLRRITNYG